MRISITSFVSHALSGSRASIVFLNASSFAQEQTSSSRLQQELKETSIRELVATGKIEMHEARMVSLTKEINSKDELYVFCLDLLDDVESRT